MSVKAVFLDRDGVLNVDKDYLYRIEDLEWIPGAKAAVAYLTELGYKIFVVTNQSGIARGYYKIKDMKKLHQHMQRAVAAAGGKITKFYYCPHHVEGTVPEYSIECDCRKPKPGMLLRAIQEYDINVHQSFLIGDKPSDIAAANKAGVRGYLFVGGDLLEFVHRVLQQREME